MGREQEESDFVGIMHRGSLLLEDKDKDKDEDNEAPGGEKHQR